MTRFFITLQQGVDIVLSALAMMRGGEIFVPKISSIKITDLAESIAPGIPTHIVGIRPGEKLHESMITEDDARSTVELPDRYVVEPAFHLWERRSYAENGAVPVEEGFRYTSDTNPRWLDASAMRSLLQEEGIISA
jgi:UDP-N-acetylglucosamine 4,6-dehydratase